MIARRATIRICRGQGVLDHYRDSVNLNLSVFWTLVVVIVGAPLLALLLGFGAFMVALLLGYDPDAL